MSEEDEQKENQPKAFTFRTVVIMLFFVVVIPFLPLLISRQWDWVEAWIYGLIGVFGYAISRLLVARRHPDLLAERARYTDHKDAKSWDKTLSPWSGLGVD
jgi:uncharacterized membrane protein YdbT with pleckstrin-like domain